MEYTITDTNFETEVVSSKLPVLVDFYANWCGPCKMMAPIVEQLAEEFEGKMKVGKCNVDDNPALSRKFGIMSIPSFVFFKNGEPVKTQVGGLSKDQLKAMMEQVMA